MKIDPQLLVFEPINTEEPLPFDLFLLADPSKALVEEYLQRATVYVLKLAESVVGAIVLVPLSAEVIEIKNVAITPAMQARGLGSYLIEQGVKAAAQRAYRRICIGTANSSLQQLYLYQKLGFELTEIKPDFFTKNYNEVIFENGIQAKHMVVLYKNL